MPTQATKLHCALALALLLGLCSCAQRRTSPWSRIWQGFTTRYNVLYHGEEALAEAEYSLWASLPDSLPDSLCLNPLPPLPAAARPLLERAVLKAQQAITLHSLPTAPVRRPGWRHDPKQRLAQQRREHNPILWRAWLLLGTSYYYMQQTEDAERSLQQMRLLYLYDPQPYAAASLALMRLYAEAGRSAEAALMREEVQRLAPQLLESPIGRSAQLSLALATADWSQALTEARHLARSSKPRPLRRYYSHQAQLLEQRLMAQRAAQRSRDSLEAYIRQQAAPPATAAARYALALDAYRAHQAPQALTQLDSLRSLSLDSLTQLRVELLGLLARAALGQQDSLRPGLEQLLKHYPQAPLSPLITQLLVQLRAGRQLSGEVIAPPQLDWSASSERMTSSTSVDSIIYSVAKGKQLLLTSYFLACPSELPLEAHEQYFLLTAYHYSHFTQQLLELSPYSYKGRSGWRISGFSDPMVALRYRRALEQDAALAAALGFKPQLEVL